MAITPALLTRMSSGPLQLRTKAATLDRSDKSRAPTVTDGFPVLARMSAETRSPAAVSRTSSITAAPALASARAVSTPIPDDAPVTMARLPARSTPEMTSAAVDENPNGVVMRGVVISDSNGIRRWAVPQLPQPQSPRRAGEPRTDQRVLHFGPLTFGDWFQHRHAVDLLDQHRTDTPGADKLGQCRRRSDMRLGVVGEAEQRAPTAFEEPRQFTVYHRYQRACLAARAVRHVFIGRLPRRPRQRGPV